MLFPSSPPPVERSSRQSFVKWMPEAWRFGHSSTFIFESAQREERDRASLSHGKPSSQERQAGRKKSQTGSQVGGREQKVSLPWREKAAAPHVHAFFLSYIQGKLFRKRCRCSKSHFLGYLKVIIHPVPPCGKGVECSLLKDRLRAPCQEGRRV